MEKERRKEQERVRNIINFERDKDLFNLGKNIKGKAYGIMGYRIINRSRHTYARYEIIRTSKKFIDMCDVLDREIINKVRKWRYYAVYEVTDFDPRCVSYSILTLHNFKYAIINIVGFRPYINYKNGFKIKIENKLYLSAQYRQYSDKLSSLSEKDLETEYEQTFSKKCIKRLFRVTHIKNKLRKEKLAQLSSIK